MSEETRAETRSTGGIRIRRRAAAEPPAPLGYCELLRALQGALLFGFGLFLIYQLAGPITSLLLLFLLVFILAAVFNPVVVWLHERGVPRIASAVGIVLAILGLAALIGWLALPPLLNEVGSLFRDLPALQDRLQSYYANLTSRYPELAAQIPPPSELTSSVGPYVSRLLGQVGRYTVNLLVGVVSLVIMLVLVVFTLSRPAPLVTGLLAAVPDTQEPQAERALRRILEQLKNWALGSLILGLIVGVITGIGLWALGRITGHTIPYILLFSVIAGLGELIPNIGPILSAIPPVLIVLTIDPMLGLWVALLFLLIQQLENNLIVPLVMGRSLDLHPVSLIFTVLVMGSLFGLIGAILAVPVTAILKVCWEEFYMRPREKDMDALQATAEDIVESQPGLREGEGPGEARTTQAEESRPSRVHRRRRAAS